MTPTVIDSLYNDAVLIRQSLSKAGEPSLAIGSDNHFRKVLLIASASYFEKEVCDAVLEFVDNTSRGSSLLCNFVKINAIDRKYHTWFSWEKSNANTFFGLFGGDFKKIIGEEIKNRPDLDQPIKSFMEVGRERNKLAHENFAAYSLEKTIDEVYALYKSGLVFVSELPDLLRIELSEEGT